MSGFAELNIDLRQMIMAIETAVSLVADVPPQDEKLRLISHFAGTYLDHAGRTAPLQVCFGARTAGGWEPIG